MSKESLKTMKEMLAACVQGQMSNLSDADTHELGEAVNMLKDLEEAIYYCTITEAMEKQKGEGEGSETSERAYYTHVLPLDGYTSGSTGRYANRSYYGGSRDATPYSDYYCEPSTVSYYTERQFPMEWRDAREGRSPISRRTYMESKELHKDKDTTMRELERYVQELSSDMVDMIKEATPEEKTMLRDKIQQLASKIQ